MKKNLKLIPYPDIKHKAEVTLTPLGSKIRYRLTGNVFCQRQNTILRNSATFTSDDLVWNAVFGDRIAVKKFLKRNKTIKMVINLNQLGYKPCDYIQGQHD